MGSSLRLTHFWKGYRIAVNRRNARVNPVGLTEMPPGFRARRRRYSRTARVVATVVLAVFALVVTVTTVVSLGAYCLTSDGSNVSGLPQSYFRP